MPTLEEIAIERAQAEVGEGASPEQVTARAATILEDLERQQINASRQRRGGRTGTSSGRGRGFRGSNQDYDTGIGRLLSDVHDSLTSGETATGERRVRADASLPPLGPLEGVPPLLAVPGGEGDGIPPLLRRPMEPEQGVPPMLLHPDLIDEAESSNTRRRSAPSRMPRASDLVSSEPAKPPKVDYEPTDPGESLLHGYDKRAGVALERGKSQGDAHFQAADVLERYQQYLQDSQEAMVQNFEDIRIREEEALAHHQAQIEELFDTPFEANRLFNQMSGAERFGLGLGVAVGAALQTIINVQSPGANTPNLALNMLNGMIERDIQEQARNFQRGVTGLGMERSAFAMARQRGMDETQAMDFLRARQREAAMSELSVIARRFHGTDAGRQAEEAAIRLGQEADRFRLRAQAAALEAAARARRAGARKEKGPDPQGATVLGYRPIEGLPPLHRTEMAEMAERIRKVSKARRLAQRAMSLVTDNSWARSLTGTEARADLLSLSAQMRAAFAHQNAMGAYDDGVRALTDDVFSDPNAFFSRTANVREVLRQYIQITEAEEAELVAASRLRHARPEELTDMERRALSLQEGVENPGNHRQRTATLSTLRREGFTPTEDDDVDTGER